jgi:pimeloyl-ACP methyl ester carboxylesterase
MPAPLEVQRRLEVDGRPVAYFDVGRPDDPGLLCLHGFPDAPENLLPLARTLAASLDRRVLVPAMPGYAPSAPLARPSPRRVADHLHAFMAAVAPGPFDVVGHDWGAVAAYSLANRAPTNVQRLVGVSVPPPLAFARNLRAAPAQLGRSRYMAQFQFPGLSEALVRRGDFAFVAELWARWSPTYAATPAQLATVRAALSPPGALTAALDYYRVLRSPFAWAESAGMAFGRIVQPTLVLTGARDACIAPEMFEHLAPAFLGPFDRRIHPTAGHFLPEEDPTWLAARIGEFMGQHPI